MSVVNNEATVSTPATQGQKRDWRRAVLWLVLLGPFFFISYGFANWYASQQSNLPSIIFDWEKAIPFVPWTIIPYWSIDVFYAISPFVCRTRHELNAHGKRLLAAQVMAVSCFIMFPLRFGFERPSTDGISGDLFTALSSFDQPFNQAPSLHIALLVILWALYRRHLPRQFVWPFHVLCFLIAVSVLTTYQHHFIDIPSGALLGSLCVWLWPLNGKPVYHAAAWNRQRRACRIASYYAAGTLFLSLLAFLIGGAGLWLLWPALSLLLVALNYVYLGAGGFQKDSYGRMSTVIIWLYWPYLIAAKINSRWWTRRQKKISQICDGVYIGRMPSEQDLKENKFHAVVDMSAEFNKPKSAPLWRAQPCLDLLLPKKDNLLAASQWIEELRREGKVLVVCALGYSRSAMAIATWLLASKRVDSVEQAIDKIRQKRASIVIDDEARQLLAATMDQGGLD